MDKLLYFFLMGNTTQVLNIMNVDENIFSITSKQIEKQLVQIYKDAQPLSSLQRTDIWFVTYDSYRQKKIGELIPCKDPSPDIIHKLYLINFVK